MWLILCIDDNTHGLTARRVLLEQLGHRVAVARNGVEGLRIFRQQKVDLVIVDYVMPQMNGGEVVREIKRIAPKVPVILLSGYVDCLSLEEKVREADCVLCKGRREISELVNAVNRLLRKSRKKPAASVPSKVKAVAAKQKKPARGKPRR